MRIENWIGLTANGAQIGSPANWMATTLQRAYVEDAPMTGRVVVVEAHLQPESYDEPVLAALAISLRAPAVRNVVWEAWQWLPAGRWLGAPLRESVLVDEKAAALFKGQLPIARAVARVVPLCALERATLESVVVTPAIAATHA